MSKKQIREKVKDLVHKTMGRSWGPLVIDPVLGDKISPKTLTARKENNPRRYKDI